MGHSLSSSFLAAALLAWCASLAASNSTTQAYAAELEGGGIVLFVSDVRLKDIAGPYRAGLEQIMRLTPIRYRYKKNNAMGLKDEGLRVGFSAQEVGKVLPEAVTRNDRGYLVLNNDPILWAMFNAIKSLNFQNMSLRLRLEKLERR